MKLPVFDELSHVFERNMVRFDDDVRPADTLPVRQPRRGPVAAPRVLRRRSRPVWSVQLRGERTLPAEVDNDVDITESSAAEVGVVKFLARIIDRPGHTERLEMLQLLSRCVTDDSRAQLLRHLHDLVTDGAATAEDEHALPAAHISGFVHDLVCRRGRQRDRRSSREIQRIGNAHKVARR